MPEPFHQDRKQTGLRTAGAWRRGAHPGRSPLAPRPSQGRSPLQSMAQGPAPSTELRQFYGHRPERFAEFRKRYHTELRRKDTGTAAISELIDTNRRRPMTLLTASRDLEHSEAAVLAEHLQRIITGAPDDPITAGAA